MIIIIIHPWSKNIFCSGSKRTWYLATPEANNLLNFSSPKRYNFQTETDNFITKTYNFPTKMNKFATKNSNFSIQMYNLSTKMFSLCKKSEIFPLGQVFLHICCLWRRWQILGLDPSGPKLIKLPGQSLMKFCPTNFYNIVSQFRLLG